MKISQSVQRRLLFSLVLGLALVAMTACPRPVCDDSCSGFKRDPKKYKVAYEFRYDPEYTITDNEAKAWLDAMNGPGVRARMRLGDKEILPSSPTPTPVPLASSEQAAASKPAATASPTTTPKGDDAGNAEAQGGWKTQVGTLLEANSDEALVEALSRFFELTAADR